MSTDLQTNLDLANMGVAFRQAISDDDIATQERIAALFNEKIKASDEYKIGWLKALVKLFPDDADFQDRLANLLAGKEKRNNILPQTALDDNSSRIA